MDTDLRIASHPSFDIDDEAYSTMLLAPLHQPDATTLHNGIVMIADRGRLHPLTLGGQSVGSFAPGWHAGALSRLLQPFLLLEFHDGASESGVWLLDSDFRHLHSSLDGLVPDLHNHIAHAIAPILDWLRNDRLSDGQPEAVAALLSLQPKLRRELEALCLTAPHAGHAGYPPLDERRFATRPAPSPTDDTLAVRQEEGRAEMIIGATGLVVRQGDAPAALSPGWRAARICTLAFPTLILELSHENGEAAVWYLDHDGRMTGHQANLLHPAARSSLARAIRPLFDQLWDTLLPQPANGPTRQLIRFLALAEVVRLDLLALVLGTRAEAGIAEPTQVWTLTDALPRNVGYIVRTRTGKVVTLDPEHARATCETSLQENFIGQIVDGETGWPSPVDGVQIRTRLEPLYFDHLCFAYRLHDPRHDLTFHVIALEWHFRTFALYFPGTDLLVAADGAMALRARQYCLDFVAMIQRHLTVYGQSIAIGQARARTYADGVHGPLVQAFRGEPALHIGHYLWQDLTGLDELVRRVPAGKLPHCLVFDSHLQAEMYGPIDRIYPQLEGRVIRRNSSFDHSIRTFYETGTRVMKITGMVVARSVGEHIMDAIGQDPAWADECADADAIEPGTPVVLLGLRVGNRTIEDQAGFCSRLIADLVEAFAPVPPVIVLDGHNAAADGATYRSVGDDRPGAAPFVETERAIARIAAATCAELGIRLVDTIGRPVAVSLIWCRRAQFFVAPWGAALAKYRWVCNRPGLVMTGHGNMNQRGDLDIYHAAAVMERPSELEFVPAGLVEDTVVDGEPPDRANFRVDESEMFALVRRFAHDYSIAPASG